MAGAIRRECEELATGNWTARQQDNPEEEPVGGYAPQHIKIFLNRRTPAAGCLSTAEGPLILLRRSTPNYGLVNNALGASS
jgi:hypothetical protein